MSTSKEEILNLPLSTQRWLQQIHRKCRYWLNKIPQLFPRITNVSDHLRNALACYSAHSDEDFVQQLIGDSIVNTNTVQQCLLNNAQGAFDDQVLDKNL